METNDLTAPLQQLIGHLLAWDETLASTPDGAEAGLPRVERRALVEELRGVMGDAGDGRRPSDPWQLLMGLFSPRAASPAEACVRREQALLRHYEQLCELDLPFHLSSMFLRHYSAIKRATHVADGRLNLPTPARGLATAATVPELDSRAPAGAR